MCSRFPLGRWHLCVRALCSDKSVVCLFRLVCEQRHACVRAFCFDQDLKHVFDVCVGEVSSMCSSVVFGQKLRWCV